MNFEGLRNLLIDRAPGVLAVLLAAGPEVTRFVADIGDGSHTAGVVTFCSSRRDAALIPDHDFMNSRGYAEIRTLGLSAPAWRNRNSEMLWRGSTTGSGLIADADMSVNNSRLIQRTRLTLALRAVPGTDVKFNRIVQSRDANDGAWLKSTGLLGESLPVKLWAERKFAFDVDGNTNAYSNFYTRLLLGCCVLKVGSSEGWRQWYYDDLRPWTHYVPVAPDLSDAKDVVAWCRGHETECEAIAAAGQAFALARTFDSELARAADTVKARWARPPA